MQSLVLSGSADEWAAEGDRYFADNTAAVPIDHNRSIRVQKNSFERPLQAANRYDSMGRLKEA